MLPQWKMSISDKWPSGTACETPFRISGQCRFLNLSHTTFTTVSHLPLPGWLMKFPQPLPSPAPVITAGKDRVKSAHHSLPSSSQRLCGKANMIISATGLAPFPLPLCQRTCFLSAGVGRGTIPSLPYLLWCFLWYITDCPTQNCPHLWNR